MLTLPLSHVRGHWMARSGLDTLRDEPLPALAAHRGWFRTLGGVDAALVALARRASLAPDELDRAVCEARAMHVSPAARGCMYVVPSEHREAALKVGFSMWAWREVKHLTMAGVTMEELEALIATLHDALDDVPRTVDAVKDRMPPGSVRSLGDRGRKVGLSTAFPHALRYAEARGMALRVPADGHLRHERYLWCRGDGYQIQGDLADVVRHHLEVAAPLRARDVANWTGAGVREVTSVLQHMDLATLSVEGVDGAFFLPRDQEAWIQEPAPPCASPRLLALVDPFVECRGVLQHLVEAPYHGVVVPTANTEPRPIGAAGMLWLRTVVDEGRIVGVWEMDLDAGEAVVALFAPLSPARRELLEMERRRVGAFLMALGDARAFALDTPSYVVKRAEQVRQAARTW